MARIKNKNRVAGEILLKEISSKIKELIEKILIEAKHKYFEKIEEIAFGTDTTFEYGSEYGPVTGNDFISIRKLCRAYEIIKHELDDINSGASFSGMVWSLFDSKSWAAEKILREVCENTSTINDLLNRWKIKPVPTKTIGQRVFRISRMIVKDPTKTGAPARDVETRLILAIKKRCNNCSNKVISEIFKEAGIIISEDAIKKRIQSSKGQQGESAKAPGVRKSKETP